MNIFERIGKAVADLSVWSPLGNGGNQSFMSMSSWLRARVGRRDLIGEYKNLVYSCVTAIAEDVARYEPFVYKKVVDGKPVPIENHPLIKLLENPNPEMSQYELFEAISVYMGLTGEAFVYVQVGEFTKRPKEVVAVLRPDKMSVVMNDKGEVIGYVYRNDSGVEVPFEIEEIWHFKEFNPMDQSRGMGATEAGKLYVDIENETSLFQWGVLKNQASPAGVLGLNGKIGRDAFDKLKKQWKESYSGTSNAGKTLFIRNTEANFTKVGLSLNDLSIGDLSKVNDEKIRKLFRLSREMLGDTSNSGLGRANIEAIEYVHAKRVIEPKFIRFDDLFTTLLRRYWKEFDTRVSHVSHIPKDEATALTEYNLGVDRWLTRNEIRKQKGLGDVLGGDMLYTPFSNIPLSSQSTAETPQVGATASIEKGHVHTDACNHNAEVKILDTVEKGIREYYRVLDNIELVDRKRFVRGLGNLLSEQKKEVLKIVERYVNKGLKKDVVFDGTLFELSFDEDKIEASLLTWLFSAFIKSGEATFASLGKPDAEFLLQQAQRDAIFNSTDRLMKSFNEQTAQRLQQQLSQGLANGESLSDITKRVESIYQEAVGYRAERIADTEVHKSVNRATAEVFKSEGYTKLVWDANADACPFCKGMDGMEVEMDQPFVPVGGSVSGGEGEEYVNDYADVSYADLHPNCQCRVRPAK